MKYTLAIDPGTEQSGFVLMDTTGIVVSGIESNERILDIIRRHCISLTSEKPQIAIEMIASYGMAVGKETFETCLWIGRFIQAAKNPDEVKLVYRRDVKLHLCNSARAKDANVRQAIIDLYGGKDKAIGKKSAPGPLYSIKSHAWSALAVGLTAMKRED